jgi:membrane-associated protein
VAAVLGDNVGYRIGRRLGPKVFSRRDGLLFRREYIDKTQVFYNKHGGKTIVIARFMAYVRTFAPVVAGMGKMQWQLFAFYNLLGGILWGLGLPMLGYFIGSSYPGIDKYFIWSLIISAHILIAIAAWHIFKNPDTRRNFIKMVRQDFHHYFGNRK